jgi:hypothetical protein
MNSKLLDGASSNSGSGVSGSTFRELKTLALCYFEWVLRVDSHRALPLKEALIKSHRDRCVKP